MKEEVTRGEDSADPGTSVGDNDKEWVNFRQLGVSDATHADRKGILLENVRTMEGMTEDAFNVAEPVTSKETAGRHN